MHNSTRMQKFNRYLESESQNLPKLNARAISIAQDIHLTQQRPKPPRGVPRKGSLPFLPQYALVASHSALQEDTSEKPQDTAAMSPSLQSLGTVYDEPFDLDKTVSHLKKEYKRIQQFQPQISSVPTGGLLITSAIPSAIPTDPSTQLKRCNGEYDKPLNEQKDGLQVQVCGQQSIELHSTSSENTNGEHQNIATVLPSLQSNNCKKSCKLDKTESPSSKEVRKTLKLHKQVNRRQVPVSMTRKQLLHFRYNKSNSYGQGFTDSRKMVLQLNQQANVSQVQINDNNHGTSIESSGYYGSAVSSGSVPSSAHSIGSGSRTGAGSFLPCAESRQQFSRNGSEYIDINQVNEKVNGLQVHVGRDNGGYVTSEETLYRKHNKSSDLLPSKTNRLWHRIKHALQKRNCTISISIIASFYMSAGFVYFYDPELFNVFLDRSIMNYRNSIIMITALAILSTICLAYHAVKHIEEHRIQQSDYNEILKDVFKYHKKEAIKSIALQFANNTIVVLQFNVWRKYRENWACANEEVVHTTNKMRLLIDNRPLFTGLLTCLIVISVTLNSGLYVTGNDINLFYRSLFPMLTSPVANLVLSSTIALSTLVGLGFHYYNKISYCSGVHVDNRASIDNPIKINELIKNGILQCNGDRDLSLVDCALSKTHKQQSKRCGLPLKQVTVTSYNTHTEAVYNMDCSVTL